jgi:hypothetical protein
MRKRKFLRAISLSFLAAMLFAIGCDTAAEPARSDAEQLDLGANVQPWLFDNLRTRYEKELSREFWDLLIGDDILGLRVWIAEAKAYTPSAPRLNKSHFQKKVAMAYLLLSSLNGGVDEFRVSSSPYILDSLTYSALARTNAHQGDGFSQRVFLNNNELLLAMLLNDQAKIDATIETVLEIAESPEYSEVQKPVFYEVLGTSLVTSVNQEHVWRGVELLEESIALFDACIEAKAPSCVDALTLAPNYEIMALITLADGYAALGEAELSFARMAEARDLAVKLQWPFLAELDEHIANLDTSPWDSNALEPIPFLDSGLSEPMPFVFNHTNACRYCHVNQQKVPQSYLPLPH